MSVDRGDSIVVMAFAGEAAAWRGIAALREFSGEVVSAAAVLVNDAGRIRVAATARDGPSARLADLLVGLTAEPGRGSRRIDASSDDERALAGILAVLPHGQVVVVARVSESDPSVLERKVRGLGGRLLHRRPACRSGESWATDPLEGTAPEIPATTTGRD